MTYNQEKRIVSIFNNYKDTKFYFLSAVIVRQIFEYILGFHVYFRLL